MSERPPTGRRGPRTKPGERSARVSPSGASACKPTAVANPADVPMSQGSAAADAAGRCRNEVDRRRIRDGEAPVATKAIVGEKVGMTQVWDDQHRADPGDGGARRAGPGRAGQDPRARGLLGPAGHLGPPPRLGADQARAGPLRQGRGRPGPTPGRAAARRHLGLRGRPGADRRPARSRRAGRRHRRLQGQGLRRRHEAPQLQGPGRHPRQPQEAPVARLDRRLRHAVPGVQGHPDGRPDGRPAGDHPQPRGRPGRPRAGADPGQGGGARARGAGSWSCGTRSRPRWSRERRPDEPDGRATRPIDLGDCPAGRDPAVPAARPRAPDGDPRRSGATAPTSARWRSSRRSSASSPTWRCSTRWSPPSWPRPGPAPSRPRPGPRSAAAGPSPSGRRAPAGPGRARPAPRSGSAAAWPSAPSPAPTPSRPRRR